MNFDYTLHKALRLLYIGIEVRRRVRVNRHDMRSIIPLQKLLFQHIRMISTGENRPECLQYTGMIVPGYLMFTSDRRVELR